MPNRSATWRSWVDSDSPLPLEQQVFQGLCLLGGMLAILVILPMNAFQNLDPWVNLLTACFGLVCLALAWAARHGRHCKKTMFLALVVFLDLNWFPNGGSQGSIGLYFFTAALILVFFFEGVLRFAGLLLLLANIVGLHFAELAWPGLLHPFKNASARLLDLSTGYSVSLLFCVSMLWVILAGFKRKEQRLRETLQSLQIGEAQNRALIGAIPDLLFEFGMDGRYLDIHSPNPDLLVAPPEALLGRTVTEMLPSSAATVIMDALREARARGASFGKNYELQLPHGDVWFELSVSLKAAGSGREPRFIALSRDITERKKAEEGLRASQAEAQGLSSLLHSILESPHGVVVFALDVDYRYTAFTSAHKEVMKAIWGVEIAPGMNMLEAILDPDDREKARSNFDRALAGEHLTLIEEYGNQPHRACYEDRYSPVVDGAGNVRGLTVFVIDITERRMAEEALRVSEEKFTRIFQMSPDAIDLVRTNDRISMDINYAFTKLFGYAHGDFIGKPVLPRQLDLWVHPEDRDRLMARLKEHGTVLGFEAPLRRKDGSTFTAEISTSRLEIDGQPYHLSITHDITERKALQEGLERSNNLLKQVLDTLPIPVYCKDPKERYTLCNSAFQTFMGRPEEELLGRTSFDLAPTRLGELYRQSDRRLLESGKTLQYETIVETPSGLRQIVVTKNLMRDPAGELVGLVGAFMDITDRKRAEEALRTSEQQLLMTQELGHTGSWVYEPGTPRIWGSAEALRIFGLPAAGGHLNIEDVEACIPERERVHQAMLDLITKGLDYNLEYALAPVDGSPLKTVVSVARLERDEQGYPLKVLGFIQDITERKQVEDERRRLLERMHQAQKLESLGVLVAGVAHNMNNVLAVIMGTASMLEELATESRELESCRIIGRACMRGRDVVRSLIQFARPSLSARSPLELHALVAEVRTFLENTTRNRIEILEAFTEEPLWMQGDAGNLNQAFMNLCLNAVDAMPNGGTLRFRTAAPERDWIEVSIEDSGEGMAPEVLAHALEPFFTTKDVDKGTGLGLSMTHGVVKAHGGAMEISSSPGRGTLVRLRFPRIPAPAVQPPVEVRKPSLQHVRVLLVDDDGDIRELGTGMLHSAGCLQVASAGSGEEALERLRRGPVPDLVILDLNMPGMDGIQTMERIRALHPEVRILVSSGQPDIEDWDCFRQPNVAVLAKPFELEEFLAKVALLSPRPTA